MRKLMIGLSLAVVACQVSREPQTAQSKGDIPIGVYAAQTGSEAAFGSSTVEGEKLAADEINAAGGVLGRNRLCRARLRMGRAMFQRTIRRLSAHRRLLP